MISQRGEAAILVNAKVMRMRRVATSTINDLREALEQAWNELSAAIDAASAVWDDRVLESEDESADAWSPRLAAWHAIAGERIRARYIDHLVTQHPGPPDDGDMMAFAASAAASDASLDGLRVEFRATRTPADMRAALTTAREGLRGLLLRLTDEDLDVPATISDFVREYISARAQPPTPDVRGSLLHGVVHLRDHARQMLGAVSSAPRA
jgi:hypothetical protein